MIAEALIRLLETDTLEDITISQIAAEAKIGRNTFYNHFRKKEEILQFVMEMFLADARKSLLKTSEKKGGTQSIRDFLLWRFSLIKTNPRFLIFQKEQDIRRMLLHFREQNLSLFHLSEDTDEYFREFFLGGLDYVTSRWIKNGMKETPEEMAGKVLGLLGGK